MSGTDHTTETERNDTATPAVDTAGHEVLVERSGKGIAVIRLGAPDELPLTLDDRRLHSLGRAVDGLAGDEGLRGVVVTGPAPGMFAAGADVKLFETLKDEADGERAAREGQMLLGKLELLKVPVVAAIDGPCLGGGLELALCADVRVAADTPGTRIGLPEVKLGIVPGFGGTQRLTRLVGLPKALELILQGKMLDARRAGRAGVVDRVVPPERLLQAATEEIEKLAAARLKRRRRKLKGLAFWTDLLPPLRAFVGNKVRKTLTTGPGRFYEAPKRALDLCLLAAGSTSLKDGLAAEAKALGEMIVSPTSRALVRLFFLTERAKKIGKTADPARVESALVVGGGVMGAGIAGLMASKGVRVRLCDLDTAQLAAAKARLGKTLARLLKRRRIQPHEAQAQQDRLTVGTDWGSLARRDLFLEAVSEDLGLKRKLFRMAVERGLPEDAVIATNTSSLPIDAMAAELPAPQRVVGIHFFNPPEKMPLVEVVRGQRTSEQAVATAAQLAVALGKFPVVVADSPGFLVNRCLAPYLNEAARLAVEGTEPERLDQVMLDFGFPMGPMKLLDEVGLDVALKVSEVLAEAFPERMQPCPLFGRLVEAGVLGAKAKGGFYAAPAARKGKKAKGDTPGPARAVLETLRAEATTPLRSATDQEIRERLVYPMIDEVYRCLDEGIVETAEDVDLGMVFGIGFPPFHGGPTRYAATVGLATIVDGLERLARERDPRYGPSPALRRAASGNG